VCLADEFTLWNVVVNTELPQDSGIVEMYPGLRMPEDGFCDDPTGREE